MEIPLAANLELIESRHPHLGGLVEGEIPEDLEVQAARTGRPSLIWRAKQGEISLHSRFDPEKEGAGLARGLEDATDRVLVVLGLGLGYHLMSALENLPPETPVVAVEAEVAVFKAAVQTMDLTPILDRPNLELLVGADPAEVLRAVNQRREEAGRSGLTIFCHPPSLRARPDYYGPLKDQLASNIQGPLERRLRYKRLKTDRLKVIIFNTGYFLMREISEGLSRLGHEARFLNLPKAERGDEDSIRRLLEALADFKPDFLLAVNHLGFDEAGILTDLLTRLEMPYASWFVDSPLLILGENGRNRSEFCSVFLWDDDYSDELARLGYERVYYLPLAADESIFKPNGAGPGHWGMGVSFVGDSMTRPVEDYIKKLNIAPEDLPRVDRAARLFIESPDRTPRRILERGGFWNDSRYGSMDAAWRLKLEGLVTWWATRIYRLELIRAMASFKPVVAGDSGWDRLLDEAYFKCRAPLDYYEELPGFYGDSAVNLNATSLQMKTGLNQRVFDVPASGSFLLTDYRRQLENLFEPGREAIVYHSPEEARDLAGFYLANEMERQAVVNRARARVLAEHTYTRRLARMIRLMQKDHG